MIKTIKYLSFIILPIVAIIIIWQFKDSIFSPKIHVEQSSVIMLERLEKVNKLITLDAYFSEVYDHKDYYYYDISPFRKKALIRIKAKVSVGYDFKKINISMDEQSKVVSIQDFPNPEILSIDHDLDYYDLTQGTFNSFTESDYNKLNKNAKDFIKQKASESDIFDEANAQKNDLIEMFGWILQSAGWSLEIEGETVSAESSEGLIQLKD